MKNIKNIKNFDEFSNESVNEAKGFNLDIIERVREQSKKLKSADEYTEFIQNMILDAVQSGFRFGIKNKGDIQKAFNLLLNK